MIEKKDDSIAYLKEQLDACYERVRKYVLMQDNLYMNYVEEVHKFNEEREKLREELQRSKSDIVELQKAEVRSEQMQ